MQHPEERAFLRAIWKKPHDMTARLVYADWLAEHGYEWEAGAVRYWCGLRPRDREVLSGLKYGAVQFGNASHEATYGELDRWYLVGMVRKPNCVTYRKLYPRLWKRLKRLTAYLSE